MLLAQAGSSSSGGQAAAGQSGADAPVSVGEELLRQAAPLPGAREKSGADWFESMFGKDWKLPLAIGGGALALLGLASRGGGGSAGNGVTNDAADAGSTPAVPSNTWNLTVTPAAGSFMAGASVRAIAQKWVGGQWQDITSTTTVDRFGRMSLKVDKTQVTAQDMVRVVIRDTGSSADHRDEVAGPLTLGSTDMVAIIGNVTSDQQVTVNPLTTLAAGRIGQDLSAANIEAIHAAVAKAFGINAGDLAHVLPSFLGGGGNAILTPDSQNYGLALGVLAGMTQAQRDAGVASDDALGEAIKLLATAFEQKDGKLVLNLEKIRSATVRSADNATEIAVGIDEGAARLYNATSIDGAGANGAQVPYINIDKGKETPAAGKVPAPGVEASISAASFADGLTLKINTADSVKAGDSLRIEFIRLGADGKPVQDAKIFTYDYVLTQKDVDAVHNSVNAPGNKGGGYFTLIVPTHIDDPAKIDDKGTRAAQPSSTDDSVFLLPAKSNAGLGVSYYETYSTVDATFQLRATGSALGFVAAGAKISLNLAPLALESVPASNKFNGMTDSAASSVRIALTLPSKISWSGAAPTLDVVIAGKTFQADYVPPQSNANANGGDVLRFSLKLGAPRDGSKPSTRDLEGTISIPENALKFADGSYINIDGGANLFKPNGTNNWLTRDNQPVLDNNIAKAIGVSTQLNTTFEVDSKPPADPLLTIANPPAHDGTGMRRANDVPTAGALNAIVSNRPEDAYSVVTGNIKQEFSISVDPNQKFDSQDTGATVRLMVSADGPANSGTNFANSILAETILNADGTARFTESNYKDEVVKNLNAFAKRAGFQDGVALKLTAYVLDTAGNESRRKKLSFEGNGDKAKFILDVQAPLAPTAVSLAAGNDTGRNTSDNIINSATPEVLVKGGSQGSVITLWSDAAHTKQVGQGIVTTLPGDATESGAQIKLSEKLTAGVNTLYAGVRDAAGNDSKDHNSLQLTYLDPFDVNKPLKLNITSTAPATAQGFYKQGDIIEVSVDFGREVFLRRGKLASQLAVALIPAKPDGVVPQASEIAKANLVDGLGSSILKFKYVVQQNIDKDAVGGSFKVDSLLNADDVLEDVAGNIVTTRQLTGADGPQSVKIDTIAPLAPTVVLPANLPAIDGQPTYSLDAATTRGFTIKAEAGSTVTVTIKNANNPASSGYTKTLTATGEDQTIKPTADELAGIAGTRFNIIATATDAAGNVSPASAVQTFGLDIKAPTASAASNPVGTVTNRPFDFVVSFDEPLKNTPTKDDFTAVNGTVTEVVSITGSNNYKVSVTPAAEVASGVVSLSIKSGSATPLIDRAGNPVATGITLATQAIDTLAPRIKARPEVDGPVKNEPINFIVEFDEALDIASGSLSTGNFTARNGTVKSVTALDASRQRYKVTVDPQLPGSSATADTLVTLNYVQQFSPSFALASDALGNRTPNQEGIATQTVDVIAPSITDITLSATVKTGNPGKSGYYHAGDTLSVTVSFNEMMKITGAPTLDLNLDGTALRVASFSKLSEDKRSAIFTYVVAPGDNAATGVALPANPIKLPAGSSITDVAGNAANLQGQAAKPANADFKIDNVAPSIVTASVEAAPAPNGLYKTGAALTAKVVFSEDVDIITSGGKPTLSLIIGGQERTATFRDRTDADDKNFLYFTYTVAAGDKEPVGIVIPANALKLGGAVITDVSGNNALLGYGGSPLNAGIKVDTDAPVVSSVVVSAAADAHGSEGLYRKGDKLIVTVTFNENVSVDTSAGSPTLKLQVGNRDYAATYVSGSGNGNALKFSWTLGADDDAAPQGVSIAADGLKLNGASITDLAGNAANLAYTAVAPNPAVKVDNVAPTITSFSAVADKPLIIDNVLMIKAKVSEALRPGATVKVTLSNGGEATLERDASDPTQLQGPYTVLAGQNGASLKVISVDSTAAKDLAGNTLSLTVPGDSANLSAVRSITVDTTRPAKLSAFQLDAASDAGLSDKDGLTNATLPSFHLDGMTVGNVVTISANYNGSARTLLSFTATAANQTVTLSGTPLADGAYKNVTARQFSVNGNASEALLLGKTLEAGEMSISTVAPTGVASSLVFDYIQDTLAENEIPGYLRQPDDGKIAGSQLQRDYSTSIQTPRFNFLGGGEGDVAVLFRDVNNNNAFDAGDIVLGRKQIGPGSVVPTYRVTTAADMKTNGHFVDVAPENALANALYSDIKLVLQSVAGSYSAVSPAAVGNLRVINLTPLKPLTDVKLAQDMGTDPTSANTLSLSIGDGQQNARLTVMADLVASNGTRTAGQIIGSGVLTASNKTLEIDTSGLNGRYENFKVQQRYAGKISEPVEVKSQSGGPLGAVTWDHAAPTVTAVGLKAGTSAARPGQAVDVEFTFNEAVKDFTEDDVTVIGGVLSSLTAPTGPNNFKWTATFTPAETSNVAPSIQVKGGSYTDIAGNQGVGSNAFLIKTNQPGTVTLAGGTGSGNAPQVGDTLTATVIDPETVVASSVSYTWSVDGAVVPGQNAATYAVTDAVRGKKITVEARYTDLAGVTDTVTSLQTAAVLAQNSPGKLTFKVNGKALSEADMADESKRVLYWDDKVEVILTDADGIDTQLLRTDRWVYRESHVLIDSVNPESSFTLPHKITKNSRIIFETNYTDRAGKTDKIESLDFRVLLGPQPGNVKIFGYDPELPDNAPPIAEGISLQVGNRVYAEVQDANGYGEVNYTWRVDGDVRSNSREYEIKSTDYGKQVTLDVSYQDNDGYQEAFRSSNVLTVAPKSGVNHPAAGDVTLSGNGLIGTVLTAAASNIQDADNSASFSPTYSFTWKTTDKTTNVTSDITSDHYQNGDSSKLVLSSDLAGKDIKAVAHFTDGAGNDEAVTGSAVKTAQLPANFEIQGPITFTGFANPAAAPKLQRVATGSNLYMLDVDGNGTIDRADATTYISNLNAQSTLTLLTVAGQGSARLLDKDSLAWASTPTLGSATGAKGSNGTISAQDVLAGDFWTSTAGDTAGTHYVWTTDPSGPYAHADNSAPADPNRLHYNVFQVTVNPGTVLPG
ncbi:Ig-like domain-containing protein [Herbaspirillum sp. CAH-3]|uniref:Ig-like domain-containing protein n=1 Tax=Herbaspirillum sp. CAH-3 TaxID=2605746 RepID=UPI0012AC7C72|nr:Ig-like domain-containing protein [Herbaspirillum sp. CAH-3]MRT29196.1 hypothetical protein [Herbaspirillum sp. CAH-3]